MDKILSWTFTVMFSSKSGKAMTIHRAPVPSHSEYEMQHTSRINPRTNQPGTAIGVSSTIHLSELNTLLLLFGMACPCLLFRQEATI